MKSKNLKIGALMLSSALVLGGAVVGFNLIETNNIVETHAEATVIASWTPSATTGCTFSQSNTASKTGYRQDSGSVGVECSITLTLSDVIGTSYTSLSIKASLAGGSAKASGVGMQACLLDSSGNIIEDSTIDVTDAVTTSSVDYTVAFDSTLISDAKAVKLFHSKINSWNTRYYGVQLLAEGDITEIPEPTVLTKTVTEVAACDASDAQAYYVTGKVKGTITKYGGFTLTDDTTDIVVYGSTFDSTKLAWDKIGGKYSYTSSSNFDVNSISVGNTIKLKCYRFDYNSTKELQGIIVEGPTKYTVTCNETENGSITSSYATAQEGLSVTITVTPDAGYELDALTRDGSEVEVIDGAYTFTMGAANTVFNATFKARETAFTDTYGLAGKAVALKSTIDETTYYVKENGTAQPLVTSNYNEAVIFELELVNDDTFKFVNGESNLFMNSSNNGVRIGTTSDSFKVAPGKDGLNGTYSLQDTNNSRYLCIYVDTTSTPTDWRCYTSFGTNYKANIDLEIVSADSYAANFVSLTDAECTARSLTSETWTNVKATWNSYYSTKVAEEYAKGTWEGNYKTMFERYSYIVNESSYAFALNDDFMGLNPSASGLINSNQTSDSTIGAAVISAVALTTIASGFFFIKKRKEA